MPPSASGKAADRPRASSAVSGTGPPVPPIRTPETEATTAACTEAGSKPDGPRVLVFTTLFPNALQPRRGTFVRDRVAAVAQHCPTRVVAPILSRFGVRRLERGRVAALPMTECQSGLHVYHPRFETTPAWGRCADGALLFWQTLSTVRHIAAEFPFDLIDAHYAFPDGTAATLLGQRFRVPVCVTLRGGDIDVVPRYRLRRDRVRRTLGRADRIFAVSEHLAAGASSLGVPQSRIRVIANGVDPKKFYYLDQQSAQRLLGIPSHQRLIVCVGHLVRDKGQHILITALARMSALGLAAPRLVIIGTDPSAHQTYRRSLEGRIQTLGLGNQVRLLGAMEQDKLVNWYRAADALVLPTFREGSPNVIREALACGTPVVASRVGGVPELLGGDSLGLMVEPGDVDGLARTIDAALNRRWDRPAIPATARQSTWQSVGLQIAEEFRALVNKPSSPVSCNGQRS